MFHIGTARTALFNYLFTKQNNGKFILRIDDTDKERSKEKYIKNIINNLKWLKLNYEKKVFYQSKRNKIYQKYLKQLLDSGNAFYCQHTKEELKQEKEEQIKNHQAPRHICSFYNSKIKNKNKSIIRFRCSDKKIKFQDLIKGELEFDGNLFGDISIAKNAQTPLYNFTSIIDDYELKISHVIRGEDHISNTPKQILIGEELGFSLPQFAHLPLILGSDKTKLSKRHGTVSIGKYKKQGYLAKSLINFMAFLGWNPGTEQEIFSMQELIKEFSIKRVQKGSAIFDLKKLDWLNGYYIRQMDLGDLTKKCLIYLDLDKKYDLKYIKNIISLEQKRLKKLSDITELTDYFFKEKLDYKLDLLIWKKISLSKVRNNLNKAYKTLLKINNFNKDDLYKALLPITEKYGRGEVLWPLRVALSGKQASPGPFEIAEVLGKQKTLKRIKQAIERL